MKTRLSTAKKAAFAGLVLIPLLIGVELGLRCLCPATRAHLFRPDGGTPKGYHALLQQVDRIHQNGTWTRAYRGRVYAREKLSGFRIVCLGGSTTWGHHLTREESWPAILENRLREMGYDVEIINAGYPWYTTAQSIANYAAQMRYYNPDIVIIMHGANDLARSFPVPGEPPPEWDYGSYEGPMRNVLATYEAFGEKETHATRHPTELLTSSAVYRLLIARDFSRAQPLDVEVGLEAFPTLRSFAAHLEYLARLCLNDRRLVVLATQANVYDREDLRLPPDAGVTMRDTYMRTMDGAAISASSLHGAMLAVRQATIDTARQLGVELADVERAIDGRLEYFLDDFHLNAEGNAVAAQSFLNVLPPMLCTLPAPNAATGSESAERHSILRQTDSGTCPEAPGHTRLGTASCRPLRSTSPPGLAVPLSGRFGPRPRNACLSWAPSIWVQRSCESWRAGRTFAYGGPVGFVA